MYLLKISKYNTTNYNIIIILNANKSVQTCLEKVIIDSK